MLIHTSFQWWSTEYVWISTAQTNEESASTLIPLLHHAPPHPQRPQLSSRQAARFATQAREENPTLANMLSTIDISARE